MHPAVLRPGIVVVAFGAALAGRALASSPPSILALPHQESDRGELEVVVRDADGGAPIAARVRVDGVALTPDPDRSTFVTAGAPLTITLAPGRYRVVASRGPEWTIASEVVDVEEGGLRTVELSARHAIDPGDHVACDFHVHAAPSYDSDVTISDRVASLAGEGIRFAVATDHNHVTDYEPSARALGLRDFASAPGVEVTTWEPSFGHFNAWPLVRDPGDRRGGAPRFAHTTPAELFAALHAIDPEVIVQVNHPRLDEIGYFDDQERGRGSKASFDFDAIEVWNGYELHSLAALDRNLQDWMSLLSRGYRVTATGNSDSHDLELHTAGYPRTYVRLSDSSAPDATAVARALREGRAFVTSGPLLDARIEGRGPGETVEVDGVVRLDVEVRAPSWIDVSRVEVWMNGALVLSEAWQDDPAAGVTRTILAPAHMRDPSVQRRHASALLEVHEDAYVIVVVRGERPMTALFENRTVRPAAFTNPIWLEVR